MKVSKEMNKNLLQKYHQAYLEILKPLKENANQMESIRFQIALSFMIKCNEHLLQCISEWRLELLYRDQNGLSLLKTADSKLLLHPEFEDIEFATRHTSMYSYYQEIARHMKSNPCHEYHEHLKNQRNYSFILGCLIAVPLLITAFHVSRSNINGRIEPLYGVNPMGLLLISDVLFSYYLMNYLYSKFELQTRTQSAEAFQGALDTEKKYEGFHIQEIKSWYETRHTFWGNNKSLEDEVQNKVQEMSSIRRPAGIHS